ncbi:MAG TPA: dipeptidase [Vicinamibacterales bacterium]|nr:dipeptidase [Vicinamibacterales bacterium]HPW19267.1 dipeptidase [Vicinamibacterales bacterium]
MNSVIDFIHANRGRYVEELTQLLAIPSISALPEHRDDVRRCAAWVADELARIGLEHVEVVETEGHPIVRADWLHAEGAPTALFYGHYDVQPADPLGEWTTPPFEPDIRDGEIFARGASDDKGQVFAHLKAIEAHLSQTGRLPINMKVVLEGEEEVGSEHLAPYVRGHAGELAASVVIISDTEMFDRGVPSICYGLRGLAYMQIELRGTKGDLHSGSYGGAVANPANVLAHVIAQLKDKSGTIRIPGFYDDVRELREEERAEFKRLPFDEIALRKHLGAPRLAGERGYSVLERTWARPTLDVNGLLAGWTGEGSKTIIPAAAMAKISMRLVPDQHPDRIAERFEAYVRKITPRTVDLKITKLHGGMPWMTDFDNVYVQAAARALEQGFGKRPVLTREGGSIPIVADFQAALDAPVVLFGFGLPDDNLHAPNEKFNLDNFFNGVLASAFLYREIAGTKS